jgi:acyl-coenzyme A thioesterase PaaI-like protein
MAAARSVAGDAGAAAATVDLAIHYLDPSRGEDVVVEGVVTRRGREIVFVEARVTSAAGTPIARSVGVVRVGDIATASATPSAPPSAPACPLDAATPLVPRISGSAFTRRSAAERRSRRAMRSWCSRARGPRRCGRGRARGRSRRCRLRGGAAAGRSTADLARAATIGTHLSFDRTPAGEDVVVETSWRAAGIFLNTVADWRASGRVAAGLVTYRIVRPAS